MSRPKLSDYFTAEFIKFFVCNVIAAGVNFSARIIVNGFTSYTVAVIIAFFCGLTTAFILNKFFVFKNSQYNMTRQFSGFVLVNLLGLLQTLVFSTLFRSRIFPAIGFHFYPDACAHLIGIGIPVFTSFLGHKYFSFGKGGKETEK